MPFAVFKLVIELVVKYGKIDELLVVHVELNAASEYHSSGLLAAFFLIPNFYQLSSCF